MNAFSANQLPTINDIQKELAERSLGRFIKQAWDVIEPATDYVHNWHIDCIAEHLEAVNMGQIKRLLINIPPRNMKSISTTVMYPVWTWTTEPYKRFISVSYSYTLSKKHNMNRRDIIKSPWYQQRWGGEFRLREDKNTQMVFENDKSGFMFATSIDGTLTGEGADVIIVDDPHNPQKAESDTERQNSVDFFRQTLPSRLNDKKKGAIIVIMQRLHEEDISGFILANDTGYTHLKLPATADDKSTIIFPMSGKVITREEGDILNPGREGKTELDQLKRDMGSYAFSGQYQQEPSPKGGGILKKHWWQFWQPPGKNLPPVIVQVPYQTKEGDIAYREEQRHAVELPKLEEQYQSWDMAFKNKAENDFVACGIWGRTDANKYLLDLIEKRLSFTETLKEFRDVTAKNPQTQRKLVEDKANGTAVMDTLKTEITGIIEINPGSDSKTSRTESISPQVESGNVYLPHPQIAPWVDDFIDRCAKFPKVKHDDIIDQMTQFLNYVSNNQDTIYFT